MLKWCHGALDVQNNRADVLGKAGTTVWTGEGGREHATLWKENVENSWQPRDTLVLT